MGPRAKTEERRDVPAGGKPGGKSDDDPLQGRSVYVEFLPVGHQVKVSAIDPKTGVEVSIIGPADATEAELERVAIQKLRYRLKRSAGEKPEKKKAGSGKSGLVV